uniref:Phage terminase, small subunit n=1 Tax=Candidatus Kentrum sp. LFY TaxID=2126342 RepID=A0A450WXK3_9GAMM|nr:MAG: Protein of unknown function (DUF3486) [Candidatus Kentron sp. LFY]
MGKSKIDQLPPEERQWVEDWLIQHNFTGYDEFEKQARERGIDVSRSGGQRWGSEFQMRLERIKIATEQAQAIVRTTGDDSANLTEGLQSLVQTKLFEMMQQFNYDPEEGIDIVKVTRAVADMSRATVNQKRWRLEVKTRVEAAAREVESVVKKGGISEDTAKQIRQKILGIAG